MLVNEPELEWQFIDGSIVKAHQHSAGAASDEKQGISKSVAGNTTKIHMAVDGFGLPIEFEITGSEAHDSKIVPGLIDKLPESDYMIADKGYDSEEFFQPFAINYLSQSFLEKAVRELYEEICS